MAAKNYGRVVGYLLDDPDIDIETDETDIEKKEIIIKLRITRREIKGYRDRKFEDIMVYYDGEKPEITRRLEHLKKYDVLDIKGVFIVLNIEKSSVCPHCGQENIKNGNVTFVYPISLIKRGSFAIEVTHNADLPDSLLVNHYEEISNQFFLVGTVVSEPQKTTVHGQECCRYPLGINRQYYIGSQDDQKNDYPWVYSYGEQMINDLRYLQKKSVVLIDGAIRNRDVHVEVSCKNCNNKYHVKDVATEFIPYEEEYMSNFLTEEDLRKQELYERHNA